MHLKQYPNAIAAKQIELLELRQTIRRVKETIAGRETNIDQAIAFDVDLKNDGQRKAKRAELVRTDLDLLELMQRLDDLDNEQQQAEREHPTFAKILDTRQDRAVRLGTLPDDP